MIEIKRIVKGIARLKPIPQVVNKIMAIVEDPDSSVRELSEVVAYDSAATANLLKVANSAYYGCPGQFDSVHQAIVFLGMDEVVDLLLMSCSAHNMKRGSQKGYGLQAGDLWRYSVASALLARDLAEKIQLEDKHLVFTAALLKDIGKVVLEQHVAKSFDRIMMLLAREDLSFSAAEKAVIGIDHAELGALTAKVWQFSPKMVDIIANHHQPLQSTVAKQETAVVYMGDLLCMMMGIGVGSDGLAYRFHREIVEDLDITEKDIQEIIAGFGAHIQKFEELVA